MSRFFEIKQSATLPKTIDMYIYSDVRSNGYNWWTEEIVESETSAEHFRKSLEDAGDITQINIYINSLGGSVMEGVAIYNQLRRHHANKTVYIDGFACSVASVIAMAGDKVIMPSNTTMMVHNPWSCVYGNATELRKAADDLDKVTTSSIQAYLQKSGGKITESKMRELFDGETYLTATECIEYGFADEYAAADIDINAAIAALEKSSKNDAQQGIRNPQITQRIDDIKNVFGKVPDPPKPQPEQVLSPTPEPQAEQVENTTPEQTAEQKQAEFLALAENKLKNFFKVKE